MSCPLLPQRRMKVFCVLGAGRGAALVSIVHACPYVVYLIAPFVWQAGSGHALGPALNRSMCPVFACFCFIRDDSWLLPPKWPYPWGISSSMLIVRIVQSSLLNPIFRSDQIPGLLISFHLKVYATRNVVSWLLPLLLLLALNHASSLCASYFPPRFASRKSTFFLTL